MKPRNIIARMDPTRPVEYRWMATDDDTYDGAEDSPTRHEIGWGRSYDLAIKDLREKLESRT